MGWVFDVCFKLYIIYTRLYALSLYSFGPRISTFSMVGRQVHIDILKHISVNMYGPRVDIHHGMFDVPHDSIFLYKLNASKATFGALPYMQLLVSWWTGVPGLPPARHLGSAKSGGSRKSVGCVAIKAHGRSVFEWKPMKGSWKRPFISQWFWGYDFCTIRDRKGDPISGPGFRHCCAVLDCCSEVSKVFIRWFSFVLDSSIQYCDHASEEKLPALTFSIFCTIEECSGLGTWLLQRGLPDPCADLVTDEWTLHEASSNPKVGAFPGLFLHSKGWSNGTNEVLVLIIELKDWRIGFAGIALKDVVHCWSHALLYNSLASETRFNGSTLRCGRMRPL